MKVQLSLLLSLFVGVHSFVGQPSAFLGGRQHLPQAAILGRDSTRCAVLRSVMQSDGVSSGVAPTETERKSGSTDVKQKQMAAEARARSLHDNGAMNALFVGSQGECPPTSVLTAPGSGTLPSDFPPGALLRIGPNTEDAEFAKSEGFLDGDGMVHSILIPPQQNAEGSSPEPSVGTYSRRYVRTQGRNLETSVTSNKKFLGSLGCAPLGWPLLGNLLQNGLEFRTLTAQKDTCNTAAACHGGRILALMEQAPPSEIQVTKAGDVVTSAAMGKSLDPRAYLSGDAVGDMMTGGALGSHGHTDSPLSKRKGERVHVSYASNASPYARVCVFQEDPDTGKGFSLRGDPIPVDGLKNPVMMHDFAMTEEHIVLFDLPLTIKPNRLFVNKFPVEYEQDEPARLGLMSRDDIDKFYSGQTAEAPKVQWFDVDPAVVLHAANAFVREDGKVVVHALRSEPVTGNSYILQFTPGFLHQWVLDPSSGEAVETCLNPEAILEFPTIDPRDLGLECKAAFCLSVKSIGGPLRTHCTPREGVAFDSVVKMDLEDGKILDRYSLPQGEWAVSESTVVPKANGGDGAYVLLLSSATPPCSDSDNSFREAASKISSRLHILDADNIGAGPVSIIDLPDPVPYGLHSEFAPWDELQKSWSLDHQVLV